MAAWLAFLLAAWNAGVLGSRLRIDAEMSRGMEAGLVLAAVVGVVAWASWAGTLIGTVSTTSGVVPIPVAPGYRLAATWATPAGFALSLAVIGLTAAALASVTPRGRPGDDATRQAFVLTVVAVVLLGVVALDMPGRAALPAIPAFAQAPAAAVAPLAALVALACLLVAMSLAAASRDAVPPSWHSLVLTAWVAATVALGAEQVARASLGIGPRDAVIPGGAASGLVLWLVASALLHQRVRRVAWARAEPRRGGRVAGWLAHVGAALVVASFAAHIMAVRTTVDLPPGQPVVVAGAMGTQWRLVNQGVSRYDAGYADVTGVAMEAARVGASPALLTVERREYLVGPGRPVSMSLRGSTGGPLVRLRVLLESVDDGDGVTVRVTALPLPVLWDLGLLLLGVSAVLMVVGRWGARSSLAAS